MYTTLYLILLLYIILISKKIGNDEALYNLSAKLYENINIQYNGLNMFYNSLILTDYLKSK